jgi:hypothetical protein
MKSISKNCHYIYKKKQPVMCMIESSLWKACKEVAVTHAEKVCSDQKSKFCIQSPTYYQFFLTMPLARFDTGLYRDSLAKNLLVYAPTKNCYWFSGFYIFLIGPFIPMVLRSLIN